MKAKCIIVDDEPISRDILKKYLMELPSLDLLAECGDAFEATEILNKHDVDLIFLDINMPGMNGIEVLRQMKDINSDLPVILSSAYPEYKEDFGAWASDEYIVKSANTDELKAAVHKYLD